VSPSKAPIDQREVVPLRAVPPNRG
jgi:hypothetical protein